MLPTFLIHSKSNQYSEHMMMEVQRQMANSLPSDYNFTSTAGASAAGRFNYFISAPTSPSRASEFYQEFNDFTILNQLSTETADQEFAFHVTKDRNSKTPISAAELFDRGTIRSPLAPQAKRDYGGGIEPAITVKSPLLSSVGSPKSKGRTKSFWSNFTPKRKKHDNPYARVAEDNYALERVRGRERAPPQSTSSGRRVARSLSPVRAPCSPLSTALTTPAASKSSRKWRLRNFLLFRSASEGRASDKDPMRKLTSFYRRSHQEDLAKASISSSRTTENNKNSNATTRRVSAHERHYTVNRAASEDLKKKTFLPYKQGILGRLAVNPTVHSLAHGFGSLPSGG